ncbi:MAG: hypothetical protein IAG10_22785, partial [Planctomycetaceae bacterium]|nr:hypothetical protein [Planctomycetaceae bacterium]
MAGHRRRHRTLTATIVLILLWLFLRQATSVPAQNAATKAAAKTANEPAKKADPAGNATLEDTKEPQQPEPAKTDKAEQSAEAPLPKKDQMWRNLPSKADLLTKPPFDWVVLKKDDTVLVVKPVQPRPKTLDQMAEKRKQFLQPPKTVRMAGESQDAFAERLRTAGQETEKMRKKLESIEIELPDSTKVSEDQDDSSYLLNIFRDVSEIIHFEDVALRRVDLLLDQAELEDAYELLLMLDRRAPGWPSYGERLSRFLLVDAQGKLSRGESEPAFVLLEQMHSRVKDAINSKDPQVRYATMGLDLAKCSAELGKAIDALIEPAVQARDFRQARFHLARLLKIEAEHPNAVKWRERLVAETNRLLTEASQASAASKFDQAAAMVEEAALVWPAT